MQSKKWGEKKKNYEENKGIDLSIDASEYDEEQSEEMKTISTINMTAR